MQSCKFSHTGNSKQVTLAMHKTEKKEDFCNWQCMDYQIQALINFIFTVCLFITNGMKTMHAKWH